MATQPPRDPGRAKSPSSSVKVTPDKENMETPSSRQSLNRLRDGANSMDHEDTDTELAPVEYQQGHMVSLSPEDHDYICDAIGAPSEKESQRPRHPRSYIYPPKGLPNGLYRDVIRSRTFCAYQFYFCMVWFNTSLFLQLILGAITTALASNKNHSTSLTVLAAMNTVNAGVLALMHNSGLPDRYKNDWVEYEKVEMCLKALIDGGVVREGLSREDIIADCFDRYSDARDTVQKNKPSAYTATATTIMQPGSQATQAKR